MAIGISLGFIASSYFTFTLHKDWHFSFYFFGSLTIIVAILIGLFVKDEGPSKEIHKNSFNEQENIRTLFSKNHIITYILIFCSLYGFFSMITWLPYYLQTERGIPGSKTGIISSLVPWASIPGAILFGYLSDKIQNKKLIVIVLALLGTACQFIIPYTQSFTFMIVGLIIYGLIGKLALDPVLITFIAENTPSSMYSRAYGIFNFAGMTSSIFAPYITGYLAEVTGNIEIGFYLSGVLLLIGGLAFLFTDNLLIKKTKSKYKESSVDYKNIENAVNH